MAEYGLKREEKLFRSRAGGRARCRRRAAFRKRRLQAARGGRGLQGAWCGWNAGCQGCHEDGKEGGDGGLSSMPGAAAASGRHSER